MKRGHGLRRKYSMVMATNLTFIFCVYMKKIVEIDTYRRTWRPYKFNSIQIIQILQPIIIDFFSTHVYKVDTLSYFWFFMIRELLLITFIPVPKIFDNEDDIFIFSKNVQNLAPAVITCCKRNINFKKSK